MLLRVAVNFRKIFAAETKVEAESDSNGVVGTYQAAIPAHASWRRELVETSRRTSFANEENWNELYEENYLVARRFLLSMGVKGDAIDDVCQDVFLQAFRYLPKFRGECSFKTWLYRICASEARRHRQKARIRHALMSLLSSEAPAPISQGEIGEQRAQRLIRQALGQLPEAERLVFVLYELEGLPGKEIAEVAECPQATVWRRLHYARKSFRAYFDEYGVDA